MLSNWFRNTFATIATPPGRPAIAKANTPFTLDEFSLVSFDQSGYPQPIPPGLAELPLYRDSHGFYSVNGPLDLTGLSPYTVYYPPAKEDGSWKDGSDVEMAPFSSDTRHTTPHYPSNYLNPDNDGFYSVDGPVDLTGLSPPTVYYPPAKEDSSWKGRSDVDIAPFSSETWHAAPHRPSNYWNPDNQGFNSINGPLDLTGLSLSTIDTVCFPPSPGNGYRMSGSDVDIASIYSEATGMTPHRPSYYLNHDTISWFATPLPSHIASHMWLTKSSAVSHAQGQSEGVTLATSLAAPGEPRFRQSRH